MYAKGHEVVHLVVGFGNAGKDTRDASGLFRLIDRLEAEMCGAALLLLLLLGIVAARGRGADLAHGLLACSRDAHGSGACPQAVS